jgi:Ca-activated chloride channel family protein
MSTHYLDNYYARLGIPKSANSDEIVRAYRTAARKFHPDTNKNPGAAELFLLVQEAYATLSDADKRRSYDTTLPDDIDAPPSLMVNTLYSRSAIAPGEPGQVCYVLMDLTAAEAERAHAKPPLNVCLVIDTSTSMAGSRVGQVTKAASQFINQLDEQDTLSVVAFNDRAELLIQAQRGVDAQRMVSRISTLQTRGGTEILQGLDASVKEVQRNLRPNSINHVVLITDGRTYGDEEGCLQLAARCAEAGLPISAIGIGDEWNEDFIDRLTSTAGGSTIYIDRAADIHKLLERKLGGLAQNYANNVKIHFEAGEHAKLAYAFRLSPELGMLPLDSPVFLGAIPLEGSLSFLLEFDVDATRVRDGNMLLADGELRLDIPSRVIPSTKARLQLNRQVKASSKPDAPPQALVSAIGKLSLYRMQERAREDLEAGDAKGAAKRMRMLATRLLSAGERSLARTVLLAADELKDNEAFGEKTGKQIKYGTRALILDGADPSALERTGARRRKQ